MAEHKYTPSSGKEREHCQQLLRSPHDAYAGTAGRRRIISNPLTISTLEGGGWFAPGSGHFTTMKDPMPNVQKAGWEAHKRNIKMDLEQIVVTG
jgi:GTPase involved in cell partitioning and DNA repair